MLQWVVHESADRVGVREVANALHIAPSSAHRLLGALAEEGFLQQDETTGRYGLGMELFRLAQVAENRTPLRQIAIPHLRDLVEACNETAFLGVYGAARQEMMFATSVDSSHPLRYVVELHKWMVLYAGASGLAIMAFLPETERAAIVARTRLNRLTENTITEPYRLEQEMAEIRARGYALTRGQRIRGAIGIAAPVFGPGADVLGDVILTIPEQRFSPASEPYLAEGLVRCAQRVTEQIGGRKPKRS